MTGENETPTGDIIDPMNTDNGADNDTTGDGNRGQNGANNEQVIPGTIPEGGGSSSSGSTPGITSGNNIVVVPDKKNDTKTPMLTDVPAITKSVKIPAPEKFLGKDGDDVADWFEAFELYTSAALWDDPLRAKFMGAFLGGYALEVWKGQCSRKQYDEDKAVMMTAFESSRQSDQTYQRFMSFEWDRKIPLTVYSSILSRYLMEYNLSLPSNARLSAEAQQALLVDKMTLLVSGPARAEIRKARPQSITSLCELLSRYVDGKSSNPAIGAVAVPTTDVSTASSNDSALQFAEMVKAVQDQQAKYMERICAMMGTIAKDINNHPQATPVPPQNVNPKPFRKIKKCGICTGPHWTLECSLKKFDKGCALCSDESHLARNCPLRAQLLSSLTAGQGN